MATCRLPACGYTAARAAMAEGQPHCRRCAISSLATSRRSGCTWRRAGRRWCRMPPRPTCSPTCCRSPRARTPPPCASMSCVWPSAPRANSGRNNPASSTAAQRSGPGCRSRRGRIVVGLDGGYVRDWHDRRANFELIVGRSMPEDRAPRYIGLVHGYDRKPKRRLFEVMRQQGLQANQDVTFLTDGGEEVRALTELVTPGSRARPRLVPHRHAPDGAGAVCPRRRPPRR